MTKTRPMNDVLSFAQVGLGLNLYDWQLETDLAIDKGAAYERIKIALVAPNGSGKTQRIVAVSALHWLNKHPKGRVIITSADSKQLDSQLWPAIMEHRHRWPGWEFLQRMVRTPAGSEQQVLSSVTRSVLMLISFQTLSPKLPNGQRRVIFCRIFWHISGTNFFLPGRHGIFNRMTFATNMRMHVP